MTVITKPAETIDPPNDLTEEAAATIDVPNTPSTEAAATPTVPNTPTVESALTPSAPNTPTVEAATTPAIPNTPTVQAASTPAAPNTPTVESATVPSAPNSLSMAVASAMPRTLTPLVSMDFAAGCYAQCGNPRTFDELFTYSRNTSASFINRRVDCNGGYEYFIDTDYVGNVENLVTYSEAFDNASWFPSNIAIAANKSISPGGAMTADEMIEDATASSTHFVTVTSAVVILTGTRYTVSVYAKKNARDFIRVRDASGGVTAGAYFDLNTGVLGDIAGTGDPTASIEHAGSGWYRCSLSYTSAGTTAIPRIMLAESNGCELYYCDGDSSVYLWGAQITESAKPQPYVKTISTAVTETFSESIRQEYDPATGESLGVLIEGASTNLFVRSEEFDNASWNKSNSTIAANDIESLDGTTSADKMEAGSTATISPALFDAVTTVATNDYTSSFYVKASEATFVQIKYVAGQVANDPRANFDIVNGVLGTVDADITASIKDMGNGWYRISSTVEAALTTLQTEVRLIKSATDTSSQTNSWTAGDGLYIWGGQCENLEFASSYIYTTSATVSRAADDLGGDISLNDGTASFLADIVGATANNQYIVDLGVDTSNRVTGMAQGTTSSVRSSIVYGGVAQSDLIDSNTSFLQQSRLTTTFKVNDISAYSNGVLYDEDSEATIPASTAFKLGASTGGTFPMFGHIKTVSIYDVVLTAQEVSLL